jgi:plastocyanin
MIRAAVALVCVWGALASGAAAIAADKPATRTVVIEGLKFVPEALTVRRGDTVVWINKDPYPHTATAKGVFDSGSIAEGQSWKYTASNPGEHPYLCTFHPNMKGRLNVLPAE